MPTYLFTDTGWCFCEKCQAGRTHAIGFDIRNQKDEPKRIKRCSACGLITERKPKEYRSD